MTRRKKTILASLAILVLVTVSINIFLFFGMTGIVKRYLPEIRRTTGLNIDLKKAWATLPGGVVRISGLIVDNPLEFPTNNMSMMSAKQVEANLGLFSLLRGIINISSLDIRNSSLTIIKNKAGKINTSSLGNTGKAASSITGTTAPGTTETAQPETQTAGIYPTNSTVQPQAALPKAILGKVRIETIAEYADLKSASPDGAKIRLNLEITAGNISTFGDPDRETGWFTVKGHLENKPESIVVDIKGRVAPVISTTQPTFDISGTIANISTKDFKDLADGLGVEVDRADLDFNIKCRNGTYIREDSIVRVKIKNLQASGKIALIVQGASLGEANLAIPLKGTFEHPDFEAVGTAISNLAGNIEEITKSLKSNPKIEKNINNAIESLFGGKKKK